MSQVTSHFIKTAVKTSNVDSHFNDRFVVVIFLMLAATVRIESGII
jgi:hypothetical protein